MTHTYFFNVLKRHVGKDCYFKNAPETKTNVLLTENADKISLKTLYITHRKLCALNKKIMVLILDGNSLHVAPA